MLVISCVSSQVNVGIVSESGLLQDSVTIEDMVHTSVIKVRI